MFENEIREYESVRQDYQQQVAGRMSSEQWMEYNEILFSAHSCAIEGNSFTVDDTRILREQGMAMVPVGHSLLECAEMTVPTTSRPCGKSGLKAPTNTWWHSSSGWPPGE